jgi:hypothetical protein
MKIEKLQICDNKFDLNLKFYFMLKHIVKCKFTDREVSLLRDNLSNLELLDNKIEYLNEFYDSVLKSQIKKENFITLTSVIKSALDFKLLVFSLDLFSIKDLLLAEAKIKKIIIDKKINNDLDPLSIKYDELSLFRPYSTRVNGALLALLFFDNLENNNTNFLSKDAEDYLNDMYQQSKYLSKYGIEPNQIFMLMFSESINQSIISDSGTNYEDRIMKSLCKIGIPRENITKKHDEVDKSTEYDLFFNLNGKTFGIGAKRTLRERYKQFIKTSLTSHIDVMIEITLGVDLNEEKARIITNHGTIIFVADEIYSSRKYLKEMNNIYSVKELTLETLTLISNKY